MAPFTSYNFCFNTQTGLMVVSYKKHLKKNFSGVVLNICYADKKP